MKEEIDTLLVLVSLPLSDFQMEPTSICPYQAGLLSAVITAFIVEFYRLLQQDPMDVAISLLLQMSAQLSNSSLPQATIPTFHKPPSATPVNVLWLLSLVFSLTAALIGLLVRQWLHHVDSSPASSSRESARVRQFRHQGMVRWRVLEVVAALPTLLQLSVSLFFVGLLELLWVLDKVTAGIVGAFVAASLLFLVVATTFFPAVFHNFPHHSPQAFALVLFGECTIKASATLIHYVLFVISWPQTRTKTGIPLHSTPTERAIARTSNWQKLMTWARETKTMKYSHSWKERENRFIDQLTEPLDRQILTNGEDDEYLKLVRGCLNDTQIPLALRCLCDILKKRAHVHDRETGVLTWRSFKVIDEGNIALIYLVTDVLGRVAPNDNFPEVIKVLQAFHNLCTALPLESRSLTGGRGLLPDATNIPQHICRTLVRLLGGHKPQAQGAFLVIFAVSSRSGLRFSAIGVGKHRKVRLSMRNH